MLSSGENHFPGAVTILHVNKDRDHVQSSGMTRVSEICQAFYGFQVSTFSIFNFSGESINHLNVGEATFSFANHLTIIGDGGCPATQDFYDTTGAETIYFTLLLRRRRKAPRADLLL